MLQLLDFSASVWFRYRVAYLNIVLYDAHKYPICMWKSKKSLNQVHLFGFRWSSLERIFWKVPSFTQKLGVLGKTSEKPCWVWTKLAKTRWRSRANPKLRRFGLSMPKNPYNNHLFDHIDEFDIILIYFVLIQSCLPCFKREQLPVSWHSEVVVSTPERFLRSNGPVDTHYMSRTTAWIGGSKNAFCHNSVVFCSLFAIIHETSCDM